MLTLPLVFAGAGMLAAAAPAAAAPETIAKPAGYKLVWADEFSGSGLPSSERWSYDTAFNKRG